MAVVPLETAVQPNAVHRVHLELCTASLFISACPCAEESTALLPWEAKHLSGNLPTYCDWNKCRLSILRDTQSVKLDCTLFQISCKMKEKQCISALEGNTKSDVGGRAR